MPRRKNWKKSVSRREVLGKEVSIHASPAHVQANGSPVQLQANGSPVQVQANGSPVQVQAMQNWQKLQNSENISETNANKMTKSSKNNAKEKAKEKAKGKCESSIGSFVKTNPNATFSQIVTESFHSINARHILFGSFHQNNERFSEQSRGFQCTANALCMLGYSASLDINDGLILDKILCEGDSLYIKTVDRLKTDGKFVQPLLSLDEIPDDIEIEKGKFIVDKQPIISGILVDSFVDHGLPSLHCALQSAFISASSGLLIVGAICSAVVKKDDLYIFFDSHSHGKNALASSEGTSVLMSFKSLDDLVTYLYAFYHSLNIDMTLQFDLLPLTIRSYQQKRCEFGIEWQLEAYFKDQKMRQAKKEKSTMTEKYVSESATCKQKKKRTEYNRLYKRQKRELFAFKEKEKSSQQASKRNARHNPTFRAKEAEYQRTSKQSARKDPSFKTKEAEYQRSSKQRARKDPSFKTKEAEYQRSSKQSARKDPSFKTKEAKYQRASKQIARKDPSFKTKEAEYLRSSKQRARKDPSFKTKEAEYQRFS